MKLLCKKICLPILLVFSLIIINHIQSFSFITLDDFYQKLKVAKKQCINNKITLIRKFELATDKTNEKVTVLDSSYFFMNLNYNLLQTSSRVIYSDNFQHITADTSDKSIVMNRFMRNLKYPLLYSILDIEGVIFKNETQEHLVYIKYLDKAKLPLKRNAITYYLNKSDSLVHKVVYEYNNNENLISAELYIEYSNQRCDEYGINELLFDRYGNVKGIYKNYKIEDNRELNK